MTDDEFFIRPVFRRLHLTNFLSYSSAVLEFGEFVALVGSNSAGKSNAVSAIKLLREIPFHGLPTAVARRGGFAQLRHRQGRQASNPTLRLDFCVEPKAAESFYEINLRAIGTAQFAVYERGEVHFQDQHSQFENRNGVFSSTDMFPRDDDTLSLPPGQSVVTLRASFAAFVTSVVLQGLQTVEINPARVRDLQEPSSVREFEPDGSNTASVYDSLPKERRIELLDNLNAIVPGISGIAASRPADKVTLRFRQYGHQRPFSAKQMSDGTLRAFGILLSTLQPQQPSLLVVEEPEVAIHLGALRTLIDILRQRTSQFQILITTHSADIIDTIEPESLRLVWVDSEGNSQISPIADHAIANVRKGLITPGELLRAGALDPGSYGAGN